AIFSNARIDSRGRGGRMPFVARSLTRDHGMDARVAVRSSSGIQTRSSLERLPALVAQLDRAPDFESGGRGFESLRARQKIRTFRALSTTGDTSGKSSRDALGTQITFSGRMLARPISSAPADSPMAGRPYSRRQLLANAAIAT